MKVADILLIILLIILLVIIFVQLRKIYLSKCGSIMGWNFKNFKCIIGIDNR